MATKIKNWVITLDLHRTTWSWFARNPQGGGGGSTYSGPKRIALHQALRNVPSGALVTVVTKHAGKIVGNPVTLRS